MTLDDRIWTARPLALTHRCVLLAIARQLPLGSHQVMINRTTLARSLETTPTLIGAALLAGEILGLCRVHKNGVIELLPEALPGLRPQTADTAVGAVTPAMAAPNPDEVSTQWVQGEFARQWQAKYKQRYHFEYRKDGALAKSIAKTFPGPVITARIAAYLAHTDPFYAQCAHSFGLFARKINDFTGRPHDEDAVLAEIEQRRAALRADIERATIERAARR